MAEYSEFTKFAGDKYYAAIDDVLHAINEEAERLNLKPEQVVKDLSHIPVYNLAALWDEAYD